MLLLKDRQLHILSFSLRPFEPLQQENLLYMLFSNSKTSWILKTLTSPTMSYFNSLFHSLVKIWKKDLGYRDDRWWCKFNLTLAYLITWFLPLFPSIFSRHTDRFTFYCRGRHLFAEKTGDYYAFCFCPRFQLATPLHVPCTCCCICSPQYLSAISGGAWKKSFISHAE